LGYRPAARKEWYRTPHSHPPSAPRSGWRGCRAGHLARARPPSRHPHRPSCSRLVTPPRGMGNASAGRTPGRLQWAVGTSPAADVSAPRCPPPRRRHALPAWSGTCPIARRDHAAWLSRVASRAAPLARRRLGALAQALPDSHGGQQTGKAAGTAPVADSRSIDASRSRSKWAFPAWGVTTAACTVQGVRPARAPSVRLMEHHGGPLGPGRRRRWRPRILTRRSAGPAPTGVARQARSGRPAGFCALWFGWSRPSQEGAV
jgi:hypothetical protein